VIDRHASRLALARELGATVLQDVMAIGDHGWISVIRDPTGAVIAMWKPKEGS